MSTTVLTHNVVGVDTFIRNPNDFLNNTKDGTVAIFINDVPAFYAITPTRLAQLLDIEKRFACQVNDVLLDTQFFEEPIMQVDAPIGKFAMYNGWQPNPDFQRQAALWGISLTKPVMPEELAAFVAWWQAEGKVFTHIQWEQKLARSVQISRASRSNQQKYDINTFSQPDTEIPHGFRGAK